MIWRTAVVLVAYMLLASLYSYIDMPLSEGVRSWLKDKPAKNLKAQAYGNPRAQPAEFGNSKLHCPPVNLTCRQWVLANQDDLGKLLPDREEALAKLSVNPHLYLDQTPIVGLLLLDVLEQRQVQAETLNFLLTYMRRNLKEGSFRERAAWRETFQILLDAAPQAFRVADSAGRKKLLAQLADLTVQELDYANAARTDLHIRDLQLEDQPKRGYLLNVGYRQLRALLDFSSDESGTFWERTVRYPAETWVDGFFDPYGARLIYQPELHEHLVADQLVNIRLHLTRRLCQMASDHLAITLSESPAHWRYEQSDQNLCLVPLATIPWFQYPEVHLQCMPLRRADG